MAVTTELRKTSVIGRILTWLLVLIVIAALVAAAFVSQRPEVVVAAVAGLIVAWLVVRFFRLLRRRPKAAFGVLAIALVVMGGAAVWLFGLQIEPNDSAPSPGAVPGLTGPVSLPYKATGQLAGSTVTLREEITLDKSALESVQRMLGQLTADTDQLQTPTGWTAGPRVDGYPTYTRTRTITPGSDSAVSSNLTIAISLGDLPIRGEEFPMLPRGGSRIELATPKGALGATYPNATATTNDPRPGGGEVTAIPVDSDVLDVTVAVLKGPLQNPAGRQLYEAFTWGPLPWAVGAFFALLSSLAGDKLRQLLGLAARRVVRKSPVPQRT